MNKTLKIFCEMSNFFKSKILFILGFACISYFIILTNVLGNLNSFHIIWFFAGIFLIFVAKFSKKILMIIKRTNKIIKIICSVFIILGLLSFLIIEIFVIVNARARNYQNADYLIVLGAGLDRRNPAYPSRLLARRINVALNYSRNNPNVIIIVSGGTGRNHVYSEAEVMSRVLQRNNISGERIIIEDRSTNTHENLRFSSELIRNLDKKVVIVSCEFHLFRAGRIANKIGFTNIGTLPAKSQAVFLLNYFVREYFAIMREIMVGNI